MSGQAMRESCLVRTIRLPAHVINDFGIIGWHVSQSEEARILLGQLEENMVNWRLQQDQDGGLKVLTLHIRSRVEIFV